MRAVAAAGLLATDARQVGRDPMLRWVVVLPVGVGLLIRYGFPILEGYLGRRFGLGLGSYETLILSFISLLMPALVGMVVGFLLLDQRDDGTLAALKVTPLTPTAYLTYRLGAPLLAGTAMTLVMASLTGRVTLSPGELLLVAVAAAPIAPVYALFLATFASNKVEGFALMKAASVLGIPPLLSWWVSEPWQWLFGLTPYYWPAKLYWILAAGGGGVVICFVVGTVYQTLLAAWLLRRFDRVTRD